MDEELRALITQWRAYTSVEGNTYDDGFEAGLGEAAAQLELLLDRISNTERTPRQ